MTRNPPADRITRCAEDLFDAESTRHPIESLTDAYPDLSVSDAYRIQLENVERRTRAGQRIVGHKIGLTAKAMQELFQVDEPDYGHLLDTMVHEEGTPLDLGELIDPQIEIEPAFMLGKQLAGPDLTVADVIAATEWVSVCFEVIDSRIIDWHVQLQDTVADNGSSARVVLGSRRVDPSALELENLATELELDGSVVEKGNTSAILGHPAYSVAWLANKISRFGVSLEAGHVVLPGTSTRSHRIGGRRRLEGRIDGLGAVSVDLQGTPSVTKHL